ncbi:MAG: hypothetical protein NVS3B25_12010 [Hymenobacter sp.]
MVERIRLLLETRQLTPTQFADAIGIARPIVSHILSGRNKPSLEVVQRILAAMPELSMPWLLNGKGPMLATAAPSLGLEAPPSEQDSENQDEKNKIGTVLGAPTLSRNAPLPPVTRVRRTPSPDKGPPPGSSVAPKAGPQRFAPLATKHAGETPLPLAELVPQSVVAIPTVPSSPIPGPSIAEGPAQSGSSMADAILADTDKPIRRIVIFYRDGSFADYQPE